MELTKLNYELESCGGRDPPSNLNQLTGPIEDTLSDEEPFGKKEAISRIADIFYFVIG